MIYIHFFSFFIFISLLIPVIRKDSSITRIVTPKLNSRKPEGKMKLRDKRLIKLNMERKKGSDKNVGFHQDISPTMRKPTRFQSNANTPTKVGQFLVYI